MLADAGAAVSVFAASAFAASLPPEQAPKANAIINALKVMLIFFMLKILVYEEVKFLLIADTSNPCVGKRCVSAAAMGVLQTATL